MRHIRCIRHSSPQTITWLQWRPAHPEPQIEEENGEKLSKDERKSRRMRKN